MEFKCGSWKSWKIIFIIKYKMNWAFSRRKWIKRTQNEILFPRKWSNLGRGKLGKFMKKVMESHGISNAQKNTIPGFLLTAYVTTDLRRYIS